MDADARHQLKQNELAEALAKLRNLRDPRFLYAAAGVGVVLVIAASVYAWRSAQISAAEQTSQRLGKALDDLAATDVAVRAAAERDLRALIDATREPGLSGYARLALARALVDRGHRDPATRPQALAEAQQLLEQIRGNAQSPPMLAASATLLLATVHESLRAPDAAEAIYRELTTDARYAGSPAVKLAEKRLESLDRARVAVVFEPGKPTKPDDPSANAPTAAPLDVEKLRRGTGNAAGGGPIQIQPGTPLSGANLPVEMTPVPRRPAGEQTPQPAPPSGAPPAQPQPPQQPPSGQPAQQPQSPPVP